MIDINELRKLTQAAKNSCESVEWSHEFRGGRYSQGAIISGEENILIVCGANYGCWRDADDDGDSQFKALGDFVAAANPATINELLDRLETAEKEREIDEQRIADLMADLNRVGHENDKLRAKIERMEQQEPVGEIQRANSTGNYICSEVWVPLPVGSKLYALPGAQPAPSIPEFCPCCGNIMRACMCCPNEDCNAVTVTAEQAKYNKQHAVARKASGAAAPEDKP